MAKPSDCKYCGAVKQRHNQRDGWCWDGGTGEDATTYARIGVLGLVRAKWRALWWRWRFRDVNVTELL